MPPSAASVRRQLLPQETSTLTEQPGPAVGQAVDEEGNKRDGGDGEKEGGGHELIWEKEKEREMRKKNERKSQGEGTMEEQMNRDLITRPLCPESVG